MNSYLLDTGIAQDYIKRLPSVVDKVIEHRLRGNKIGICVPVLGELWSGVFGGSRRRQHRQSVILALNELVVWPYSREAAEKFGELFISLRKSGRPMQQIDVQIAAIAFTLPRCTVVSRDGDFRAIRKLSVEDWSIT